MTKRIYGTLFYLTMLFAIPAFAGYYSNQTRIAPDGNVYFTFNTEKEMTHVRAYDSINKKFTWDYTVANPTICNITSVSLDPTGNKIVYSGGCKDKIIGSGENSAHGFYFLKVMDRKSTKEIGSFDHGKDVFSFSPTGDAIVYAEEHTGDMDSSPPLGWHGYTGGVWLYNFNTKTKKQLKLGAVDINWSAHDGNIYSSNGIAVYRYNVKTGKVEATPYHGIYFSPDGKYNIDNYDRFRIFRTSDNQEMIELENQINNYQFICWSDNKLNSAIFWNGEGENVVFDLEQGKIIGKFSGGFIGTNPARTKVAVHPLGPDRKPQIDKIEILNLLNLIQRQASPPAP